jgi:DNA/RNA endonuclease YhcR with UshA esterase domain
MFGRQERLAIVLLVAIAGVVIVSHIVLDHVGKRPFATPFTGISKDGDLVIVSGTVDALSLTKTGGNMILEIDNVTIFIPQRIVVDPSLARGSNISVMGIVQTFGGKKEIAVQSASDIIVNR